MATKKDKREEQMRGGLNALFGGTPKEAASPIEPTSTPTETIEQGTPEEEDELIASITDEELKTLLHQKRMAKRGRPRKGAALRAKEEELYTRTTWIMRRELLAKLKEISFQETLTLKEIMEQIVSEAVSKYEETHGEVIPKEHRGDATSLFK